MQYILRYIPVIGEKVIHTYTHAFRNSPEEMQYNYTAVEEFPFFMIVRVLKSLGPQPASINIMTESPAVRTTTQVRSPIYPLSFLYGSSNPTVIVAEGLDLLYTIVT